MAPLPQGDREFVALARGQQRQRRGRPGGARQHGARGRCLVRAAHERQRRQRGFGVVAVLHGGQGPGLVAAAGAAPRAEHGHAAGQGRGPGRDRFREGIRHGGPGDRQPQQQAAERGALRPLLPGQQRHPGSEVVAHRAIEGEAQGVADRARLGLQVFAAQVRQFGARAAELQLQHLQAGEREDARRLVQGFIPRGGDGLPAGGQHLGGVRQVLLQPGQRLNDGIVEHGDGRRPGGGTRQQVAAAPVLGDQRPRHARGRIGPHRQVGGPGHGQFDDVHAKRRAAGRGARGIKDNAGQEDPTRCWTT
ncbi:hypothetical protein [Paracidovorax citrulli]|uniref:hypothetical protein n=1 Tax=Paracidovorax citrulli TaxID=80869 RepID=UPI00366DDEBB